MDEAQRALDLAFKALNRRERSVGELRAYLEGKRVEPDAIDAAVAELERAGLLDDAGFARRFAEDKRTLERWGAERIERELRRRGVARDLVEAAVAQQDRDGELVSALALLAEKVREPPADDRGRDRAWRMLVRKGYAPELAYDAVRAHMAG
ncbi:MAG TPA: regulatory protein RecX [Thermoleophilaceae bacterium]|nr:regulatory protein RecX [Thermoleophilaceae bacterium]